ncbi:MAG: hypothetical protein KUG77_05175, partial [Nannocystaceae bacterium]|nr:hypothetical protein [Nannocystaceae bacterium]
MRQVLPDRFERPRRAVAITLAGFFVAATPQASVAVAAAPEAEADPAALFSRAETLYREGRYEEAIGILEELVDGYPEAILRFNLGRAYE